MQNWLKEIAFNGFWLSDHELVKEEEKAFGWSNENTDLTLKNKAGLDLVTTMLYLAHKRRLSNQSSKTAKVSFGSGFKHIEFPHKATMMTLFEQLNQIVDLGCSVDKILE